MVRSKPCKAMLGCYSLQGNPGTYQVWARKYTYQSVDDEFKLEINQSTRKYWNLTDTSESIELAVEYASLDDNLPSIICFAWCNADMSELPPPRDVDGSLSTITNTAKMIQRLEETDSEEIMLLEANEEIMTSPVKVYSMGSTGSLSDGAICDSFGICRIHFTFEWLSPEAVCSSNFVCLKLDSLVCQDYGVYITYRTTEGFLVKNETVCEPLIIHDGTIGAGQEAIVTLWFKAQHRAFNADCFFWCTQQGQMPQENELPDRYVIPGNVEDYQWFPVNLGLEIDQDITISPKVMYNITVHKEKSTDECHEDICWSKATFYWPYPKKCSGMLICQNLTGNICGNYGLVYSLNGNSQSICQRRIKIPITVLQEDDKIEVEYWHHHSSSNHSSDNKADIQCFLWCSSTGVEPKVTNVKHQLLHDKDLKPISNGMGLSPHFMYHFNDSTVKPSMRCSFGKCLSIYNLFWHNKDLCTTNVICPHLSGNICGDFAVGVSFSQSTVTLCERGDLIQGTLQIPEEHRLMIYIYSNVQHFDSMGFQCFLWCNNSQSIVQDNLVLEHHELTNPKVLENATYISPVKTYQLQRNRSNCSSPKCVENILIKWAHEKESCMLNIMCPNLGLDMCGSYGLIVNNSFDVCNAYQTYKIELRTVISLQFWSTEHHADVQMDCRLWCVTDQDFHAKQSSMISSDFLMSQVNNSSMKLLNFEALANEVIVSPYKVYKIQSKCYENDKCGLHFIWKRSEICQARLVCPRLTGNPCGDYILEMVSIDEDKNQTYFQPVCFDNLMYETNLNPIGNKIDLILKQKNSHNVLECYFWCSSDSLVPLKPTSMMESNKDHKEVAKLLTLNNNGKLEISPMKYYSLELSICVNKTEENMRTWPINIVQNIKNKMPYINIYCSHLAQDVCGAFGFHFANKEEICFKDVLYSFDIPEIVDVWSFPGTCLDVDCILWTSSESYQWLNESMHDPLPFNHSWLSGHVVEIDFNEKSIDVSPTKVYKINGDHEDTTKCQDEICSQKIELIWHWDEPCEENLHCPFLSSNICESFGLILNDKIDICQSNKSYILEQSKDPMSLELWFKNNSAFDYQCYFWCHNDLATRFWNSSLDTDLLIDVQKRTKHLLDIEHVHDHTESVGLSPVRLYHLNTSQHINRCPAKVKCYHDYNFHWHGKNPCHLNLVCSHLGQGICANHGLIMRTEHGNGELDQLRICHTDQIYEASISKDSQFRAEIWHVLSASINMSCYFWCQNDNLEEEDDQHHDHHESLPTLPSSIIPVDFESDNLIALSNNQVYTFELNEMQTQCSQEEICTDFIRFKWHSPFSCQINLACSSLTGNICGDYGFELNSLAICHPNKIYTTVLASMQTLNLMFWHTNDNKEFKASCYLWCENTGQQFTSNISSLEDPTLKTVGQTSMAFQEEHLEPVLFSLEPNKVQKMTFNWNQDICQVSKMCVKNAYLVWLESSQCQFNLFCPVLQGDICSLVGLDVRSRHFNASICQSNKSYQHDISAHDVITLTFWHTPLATFFIECYAWCNQPEVQENQHEWRTMHVSTSKSPACQGNCSMEQTFHWKLSGICLASFQCFLLDGGPCSTYGLNVSFPHSGLSETFQSVCIENSVVLGKLEFNQSVVIRMWYDTSTTDLKKADCRLWCSNHVEIQKEPRKVRIYEQ